MNKAFFQFLPILYFLIYTRGDGLVTQIYKHIYRILIGLVHKNYLHFLIQSKVGGNSILDGLKNGYNIIYSKFKFMWGLLIAISTNQL